MMERQHRGRTQATDHTSSQYDDSKNRLSLPPPSVIPSRRSSNLVKVKSASPEVISSLISTLSAISSPIENQFDSLSLVHATQSVPSSPHFGGNAPRHDRDGTMLDGGGFGMDYGAYDQSGRPQGDGRLHPDDAAIPPVVRTVPRARGDRPTSGLSIFTSPKRTSLSLSHRVGSKEPSICESEQPESARSIGRPSIEPAARSPAASITSFASSYKAELRGQRSLDFKSSKGKVHDMDREWKRKNGKPAENGKSVVHDFAVVSANSKGPSDKNTGKSQALQSPCNPTRGVSLPLPAGKTLIANTTEEGFERDHNARAIPMRDSSLRHSLVSTTTRQKRRSLRSDFVEVNGEADQDVEGDVPSQPVEEAVNDPEEGEVSKRIKELKAQKEIRDRQRDAENAEPPADSGRILPSGRASLPATLHVHKTLDEPGALSRTRETGVEKDVGITRPSRTRSKKLLAANYYQRSVSADGRSPAHASGSSAKPHTFQTQYEAQKGSIGPSTLHLQPQSDTLDVPSIAPKRTSSNPSAHTMKTAAHDGRPSTADSIDDEVQAYLSSSRLSQKINYPGSGRVISFSEVGDPGGYVVFCCVGMGLTRYLTAFYDDLALTLKLRLITIDRPGVGESEPYTDGTDTPLGWPDDVRAVCQHLNISRFSILAHSAGAIYALATALRMPQHIRGRIHLLAPWIPPSQLSAIGTHQDPLPVTALPYSQRILRSLPTPFLKAANSNFFSATSTSITTSLPRSPRRTKRRSLTQDVIVALGDAPPPAKSHSRSGSRHMQRNSSAINNKLLADNNGEMLDNLRKSQTNLADPGSGSKERQMEYDTRLTHAIWDLSTANANPAVDLIVCLERRQEIGFRYVDINKAVVIHHGSKDSRVPVENVKWLGKTMRRCEVRVLPGEGHGLMASASVMGSVLTEMSKEWEDWNLVVKGKRAEKKATVS